jgi:ADP-ribose pyrophosphatase
MADMLNIAKKFMIVTSSKEVYRCRIFRVTEDSAEDKTGFTVQRSVVRHPGSAVMMPVDGDRVLLVRQYRLPVDKTMWELPAGKVDDGETPFQAAQRELIEETGYTAATWKQLVSFYPSPGFLEEKMTIFLATGLTAGTATPMDDERIETRWFGRAELREAIRGNEIEDSKTMIGFLFWDAL